MLSSIGVKFSSSAEGDSLDLELDEERNGGASSFSHGAEVWIRAYTKAQIVDKGATMGTVAVDKTQIPLTVEDDIIFSKGDKDKTLDYVPEGNVSWHWVGRGLGNVTVAGKHLSLADEAEGYGILRVSYSTLYCLLKLSGVSQEDVDKVIVWAQDADGREGYLEVSFSTGDAEQEDLVVTVRDYCTGEVVSGASVYIDGTFVGTTNDFGQVAAGRYSVGVRHSIRVTAPGYTDSATDALANDYFTL